MSNRLLVNPGTPQAWEIDLKPGVNRIGRGEQNDFTINHPSISTQHCELTVTDTEVRLKDLGSTNGTFVERVPVTEIQLYNGQHVQFGAVDMMFESDIVPALPAHINEPAAGGRIVTANFGPAAPPPPAPVGGLRITRPPAAPSGNPPTPPSVPVRPAAPVAKRVVVPGAASVATADLPDKPRLVRGISGAIVGGLLGMFLWYFLIKVKGYEIGYVAWGVGVVVGFGGRLPSPRGSHALGIVCGVCALVAILGGQYFALLAIMDKEMTKLLSQGYREQMQVAQTAVNAKTREEIVQFLADHHEQQPSEITEKDITEFKEKELPKHQDFVNGKPSKEEYVNKMKSVTSAFIPKGAIFKESIGVLTLLWIFLGVGTAWKIGSGAND